MWLQRLGVEELDDAGAEVFGALVGGEVAAVGHDFEAGVGNERVHGASFFERGDVILVAPEKQDRHFETGEFGVCDVFAGQHGAERPFHDPSGFRRGTQEVRCDKVW